ncbi:hypothetical protein BKA61DRAFT_705296 [Leptodontidium sp. MPI-SDFR-AT-0119]|nr:hypothetical protein BKA61DRAFT_705296 [Leptodontidium sp. MPI-SDFR-AT-0119]
MPHLYINTNFILDVKSNLNILFLFRLTDQNFQSSKSSMSAQTFFPFLKLPTEIRIKIWQLADYHSPSIIRLKFCVFTTSAEERQPADSTLHDCSHHYDHIFIPPQTVPSRLHVCRESRYLTLRQYTRGFPVTLEVDMGNIPEFRSQGHFEELERTDKTPSVHEQSVMLQNKEMYWNPSLDVVVWQRHAEMDVGATLWNSENMAYLWICHPENLSLVMKNAKNVAIPFYMFRDWLELSNIGHTPNPEVVYFVLERRPSDNDEFWEGQVNWYSEWMGTVL